MKPVFNVTPSLNWQLSINIQQIYCSAIAKLLITSRSRSPSNSIQDNFHWVQTISRKHKRTASSSCLRYDGTSLERNEDNFQFPKVNFLFVPLEIFRLFVFMFILQFNGHIILQIVEERALYPFHRSVLGNHRESVLFKFFISFKSIAEALDRSVEQEALWSVNKRIIQVNSAFICSCVMQFAFNDISGGKVQSWKWNCAIASSFVSS